MNFNNTLPEWKNTGTEPSDTLKENGFSAGYKPPANIFNWFWNKVIAAIKELQTNLSNVDNTSDLNKPISTAVKKALNTKATIESITDIDTFYPSSNEAVKFGGYAFIGDFKYIISVLTENEAVQYAFSSIDGSIQYRIASISINDVATWSEWKEYGTTFANIIKNSSDTTGDIISTHLTVGSRGSIYDIGDKSFTSGQLNSAIGKNSAVIGGYLNSAEGENAIVLGGQNLFAKAYQVKTGHFSKDGTAGTASGTTGDAFIIGNGTNASTLSNCFRVGYDGYVYGGKTFAANSADNAHFYEWLDGNPNNDDRRGLFVTLDGTKIRLATPEDTYIKGVVSAQPSFVSNAYSDNWQGMYLKDIFGAYLKDENGNYIINPDYDASKEYIPRENRPEWDWVTNDGDIVLVDDGTCEVNGFATVGAGGKATKADTKTEYRVMERKDDTHIYVSVR